MSDFTMEVTDTEKLKKDIVEQAKPAPAEITELKKQAETNAKLMIFVLTDGKTNSGHCLNDVEGVLRALKIPIYTIGYNADLQELQVVSSINEAASINADTEDIVYKLGSLFNAEI